MYVLLLSRVLPLQRVQVRIIDDCVKQAIDTSPRIWRIGGVDLATGRGHYMQGYYWARTPENELFVVLMVGGKGYVPGIEDAIDLTELFVLEPVRWPEPAKPESQISDLPKPGALVRGATHACAILPFAANG